MTGDPHKSLPAKPAWASNIAAMRKVAGMTQAELAGLLGASQSTVASWERGQNEPNIATMERIADALHVRPEEIAFAGTAGSNRTRELFSEAISAYKAGDVENEVISQALSQAEVVSSVAEMYKEIGLGDLVAGSPWRQGFLIPVHHLFLLTVDIVSAAVADKALGKDRDEAMQTALREQRASLLKTRDEITEIITRR